MKLKLAAICSVALLACAAASAPAFAGTVPWNFWNLAGKPGVPGTDLGSYTYSWTVGSQTLTATAMTGGCTIATSTCSTWATNTNTDLYAKNGGTTDEQGLGLTNDPPTNEIAYPNGIQLTLPTGVQASNLEIGSIQGNATSGETWAVYGLSGNTWNLLDHGMGGNTATVGASFLSGYSELLVSDPSNTPFMNSNDVVLMNVTTTVPEPGTLALFGAGLLGCGLFLARRRRARQS